MINTEYTTVSDMKTYFDDNFLNQFTVDDGTIDTTDDVVIGLAVDASNNLIDSFICKKYSVPITNSLLIPDVLKQIARYFTYYELYIRRDGKPDADMMRQREDYLDLLKRIAKGEILLDGLDELHNNIRIAGRRMVFNDDILSMY